MLLIDAIVYGAQCVITKTYKLTQFSDSLPVVWTNHIVIRNCCQQQDEAYRNAWRVIINWRPACCFTAPICQKSQSGHNRSYCKKLLASKTNLIVMHRHILRYCFLHRCLDKSDRIGIETCSAFYCSLGHRLKLI